MHAKGYDAGGISGDWRNQYNGVTSRDAGKGPEAGAIRNNANEETCRGKRD